MMTRSTCMVVAAIIASLFAPAAIAQAETQRCDSQASCFFADVPTMLSWRGRHRVHFERAYRTHRAQVGEMDRQRLAMWLATGPRTIELLDAFQHLDDVRLVPSADHLRTETVTPMPPFPPASLTSVRLSRRRFNARPPAGAPASSCIQGAASQVPARTSVKPPLAPVMTKP